MKNGIQFMPQPASNPVPTLTQSPMDLDSLRIKNTLPCTADDEARAEPITFAEVKVEEETRPSPAAGKETAIM